MERGAAPAGPGSQTGSSGGSQPVSRHYDRPPTPKRAAKGAWASVPRRIAREGGPTGAVRVIQGVRQDGLHRGADPEKDLKQDLTAERPPPAHEPGYGTGKPKTAAAGALDAPHSGLPDRRCERARHPSSARGRDRGRTSSIRRGIRARNREVVCRDGGGLQTHLRSFPRTREPSPSRAPTVGPRGKERIARTPPDPAEKSWVPRARG